MNRSTLRLADARSRFDIIHGRRIRGLRDLLKERKLEGYLVTNLPDLFYLTGYKSEGYHALIGLEEAWLFLPNLLYQHGKDSTQGFNCLKRPFWKVLTATISKNKLKKLAFDPDTIFYQFGRDLSKRGFKGVGGLLNQLRIIKDRQELAAIGKACHLAHEGYLFIKSRLKPGVRESSISIDLESYFRRHGSSGIAFDTIIAAGPHSAFPHHITSDAPIKQGDPVVMDLGCIWEGYRSDLTRTVVLGRINGSFSRIYRLVETAQKQAIWQVRPGQTAHQIDATARKFISRSGYGKYFIHGTGHGVGIDIHEAPRVAPGSQEKLRAGMVITVEPGIYLPGKFGVRIEDTLLVTETGHEILTK